MDWLWRARWIGFALLTTGLVIGIVLLRDAYWTLPTPKPVVVGPPAL